MDSTYSVGTLKTSQPSISAQLGLLEESLGEKLFKRSGRNLILTETGHVVLSYAVQWDADHPLHKGRDGSFTYFPGLFSGFLNPPLSRFCAGCGTRL